MLRNSLKEVARLEARMCVAATVRYQTVASTQILNRDCIKMLLQLH